jgi:amino acid adenylation domain-containing protein
MQTQTVSGFQVSSQQKRLWHLQQNSSAFCSQASISINGNLQPEILEKTIKEIVNHHDILKTNFYCPPGLKTPVMVVADKSFFDWEYLDLSDAYQEDIATKIQELFWQARQEYQNLDQVSPLRLFLIKLSDSQHILIISLPALYADTKTIKNLVNQISQFYAHCCQGKALSTDYVQYIQFSEWQNQLLADENAEEAKAYWQQQKINSLSALRLPHERQEKSEKFIINDRYQLAISQELSDQINYFAKKYDKTPDVILLTCWQILIWRLTGESEIVIGAAASRREYEELNDVLGLLATWLPIKTQFTPNLNFTEVLAAVAQTLENAAEWQDYFVPEAVEKDNWIAFPIGFEFVNIYEITSDNTAVKFTLQDIYSVIEPFKVKLTCLQRNNGLVTEFDYDSNYFSQETIQRLAKNFQTLLINIFSNPNIAISKLEIISNVERQKLLVDFNQTKADYQRDKCIHQLFEEQVEKTPDAVAVVFVDAQSAAYRRVNEAITYQQLNLKANQLAHYLQKLGVKSEVLVGIYVERNIKFIISLLAVLKAGGAYLPLDPSLPQEALQFRLQDAQAAVLIREKGIGDGEDLLDITEVNLENDWEIISQESTENLVNNIQPENLVYIIYTSGSTGKPKGVAVEHQQLLNYLYGILPKLQLPTNASYASVSTFAADLGNTIIFPCLSSGGCLHIISWERASDPAALADYFRRYPIDCLKIVPSHLAALLSSEYWEIIPRQLLILGGEAADWNLIEKIAKNAPNCRVINHYGPTETTVGVLTYDVGEKIEKTGTVPIGKPIANTQVYVLDTNLQPVPLGVAGELYIGGESLARGYINCPELTREKFINCQLTDSQQRLYKTGDRVRYLSNGNLEFLGRFDDQVKIRGYRIELGEISTALSQHPAVKENVVIAREETSTEKGLIAYIVPTSHAASDHDFCNFLKAKLPEYMIPASFVILKSLPLTTNGKLDRHALPAPEEIVSRETNFLAPRTPVEEVLAGIWGQLLGVAQVSINDNFFELGGHSLLATQVISRIRTTFNVEIPLPQLFESANLAALAAQIEIAMRGEQQEIKTITPVPRNQNLPLSFAQQRLWFFDQFEPGRPSYNLPRTVRLQGKLNIDALASSLNEIIKRHEILRTSFAISDGQSIQVISLSVNLPLPVVDLQNIPQEQREAELYRLANEEAQTGFDLTQAPLLRAKLLQLDAEDHVILLTFHHIVSDGWSTDILIREVAALYTAFCAGKPSPLPQLPIQYADFAVWQRQWLEGEGLKNQLVYWKQQLSGELPILQLPTDRPRPTVQTYAGNTLSFLLPASLSAGLNTLSKQEGVTLFMTLLAAFKTLLYRYTGETYILVGSPIANRNRGEIENLIGSFVNTLVLRSNLSGDPIFRDFLKQVREVSLGAYAHQDLPFEKLVEEIQPERHLGHNPLFQVWFALHNQPMSALQLGDLVLTSLEVERNTSEFDLSLDIKIEEEGLTGIIEYSTELFESATIARIAEHFHTLLDGIVANPEAKLSELPLLSAAEKHQLLEWNSTQSNCIESHSIHEKFEAQVEKTPDAVAVIFAGESLTYRELNQKANQLANCLQNLGVTAETLVGICMDRSLEIIIGILGTLKAGGAYVPLDPTYPVERLGLMLQDAQVPILLTQKSLVNQLPKHQAQVICLDQDWETIGSCNCQYIAHDSSLAYVIYTSGSTGEPKGVCCHHLGVLNLLAEFENRQSLKVEDACSLWTSFSFDVSVYEIFSALLFGATLHIVPEEIRADSQAFIQWLHTHKITSAYIPPFMLPVLATWLEQQPAKLELRRLLVGVEPILEQTLIAISDRIPGLHIINGYGPTEATICTTLYSVPTEQEHQRYTPIGKPVNNTQIYLLDQHLQSVPIGIPGEIYIGGIGLAKGYLNRPELTSEKFISNPFDQSKSTRLYKTGDIARYLPDGNIEFIGRSDYQVKIRGFRIELGEIESVLKQHPSVQDTVVVTREDIANNKQLVAYLIPQTSKSDNFETEYVSDLQLLYDQFYSWQFSEKDPSINLRVWTSRYTNQTIPEAEIIECVENTVERILALQPQRVLEIGCGTGLILSRVAPHCQHYCGLDISETALQYLQQLLAKRQPELLTKVTLLQGIADQLEGIEAESVDVIILNEIIQNFPSIDYLVSVLERAIKILKPGGCIFIGGVRSLPLLEAFHRGVQLNQAEADLTVLEFKKRIQDSLKAENELVIAPNFFTTLQQHLPQIGDVQMELKGGRNHNELTKFKYDVILRLDHQVQNTENQSWLDWQQQALTVENVQQILLINQPNTLKIANIPNARVAAEIKTLELLATADEVITVEQLREKLTQITLKLGIDPQDFCVMAKSLAYTVKVSWSENSNDGCYSVVFCKQIPVFHPEQSNQEVVLNTPVTPLSWGVYANQPLQQKQELEIISQLRSFAQSKLPDYMVPQFFVTLPAFPLTPTGKIDRKALPAPDIKTGSEATYVPPCTPTEQIIADIWADVLGLEKVGIYDNFFDLGGHSLLATQVISRLREAFKIDLPLRSLFENPTVKNLVEQIEAILTVQQLQAVNEQMGEGREEIEL